jgi:hypothetical protein
MPAPPLPLDIDSSRRFDSPERLVALLRAVLDADPNDEKVWIEWKGGLDLATAAGQFNLGRQILGFANRMPEVAAPWAEGHAYVIVGAEPGGTPDRMPPMDPAVLENRLRAWVGTASQGPRWHGSYVAIDGGSVLVVEVDPPRWGDPIYPLRRGHDRVPAGIVLVRHAGSVEPATPADMDALNARAGRRATPRVAVDVGLAPGAVPLHTLEVSEDAVEEWLEARRKVTLRSVQPKLSPTSPFGGDRMMEATLKFSREAARMREQLAGIMSEPDDRTEEDYRAQVERHIEACRKALPEVAFAALRKREMAPLRLRVLNLTDTNLPGVEVSVHFPGPVIAVSGSLAGMPGRPRPFGEPKRPPFPGLRIPDVSQSWLGAGIDLDSPTIENGGSVRITYADVDLRPLQAVDLRTVHLGVAPHPNGRLVGSWSATSTAADGVAEGTVEVELQEEPLSLWDLLPDP